MEPFPRSFVAASCGLCQVCFRRHFGILGKSANAFAIWSYYNSRFLLPRDESLNSDLRLIRRGKIKATLTRKVDSNGQFSTPPKRWNRGL